MVILGMASFPAWRITQPASEESNSSVKNCGKGVGEDARVGVGAGVSVRGTGVGGIVAVGRRGATGVGVACRQATMKNRHPRIRNFFMASIKTQLSSPKDWTIVFGILRL